MIREHDVYGMYIAVSMGRCILRPELAADVQELQSEMIPVAEIDTAHTAAPSDNEVLSSLQQPEEQSQPKVPKWFLKRKAV